MKVESLSLHLILWLSVIFCIAYAVNRWTRYEVNGVGWVIVALVAGLLVYMSPLFFGAIYS